MKKKTNLNNKYIWAANVINQISIINKRDKKIWVYGAWLGEKYSDNSKYFFEYMNENHKEIRSVWISNNNMIVKELNDKGYEAYVSNSKEGIRLRKKAGVAIFTNSIMDLGNMDILNGAYRVALWHGMPLKKIYLMDNNYRSKNTGKVKLFLKYIKKKLYSDVKRNLSIATSPLTLEYIKNTFGLNDKDIILSGQPRNDIFLDETTLDIGNVISHIENKNIYDINAKFITYMPTYRTNKENAQNLSELINNIANNEQLKKFLCDRNYYILIKGHYLLDCEYTQNERIIFLNDNNVKCTQKLLKLSDILVTDYSSVFIDYLIMNRPVVFLASDFESYNEYENGVNENYEDFINLGYVKDIKSFIDILYDIDKNKDKYINESIRLNNLLNTVNPTNKSYSENVYNEIIKRI